jgi:uncharacterized phage-associated protein
MLTFAYNPRKAAQAAAYLVHLNGGRINVLSLTKLLYLADRKALVLRGRPITGDKMVSMPHGPVLSRIYDQIKCGDQEEVEGRSWYEYLTERQDREICLREAEPLTDELSDFERDVLHRIHSEYGHLSPSQLRAITHELPEYEDPDGSSLPIDPETILRHEGWNDSDIREAAMSAREELFLHKLMKMPMVVA